jgi:aspartyl-tRNA(Asn)/glutamyl-tRNA(Gln) amidotransferase subunit C
MALQPEDISRIAHLARLELAPTEGAQMLTDLNAFFDIVAQMQAVNTKGIEPLYTPLSAIENVTLRLRDDAVTERNEREVNQQSAPAVENGLFLVPKVIE